MILKLLNKSAILNILLFSLPLFAMTIRHWASFFSFLCLIFGLCFFWKNIKIIKKDKAVLILIALLSLYFISTLISNSRANWTYSIIRSFDHDLKNFLVIFWLIAIYQAKNNWLWFYRCLPIAGIILGLHALYDIFILNEWRVSNTDSYGIYNPIFFGSWSAILSFMLIYSYPLSDWQKILNKKIVIGFYILSFCLLGFVVIMSMSRGAWLTYFILSIIAFFIYNKKKTYFLVGIAIVVLFSLTLTNQTDKTEIVKLRFVEIYDNINAYLSEDIDLSIPKEQIGTVRFRLSQWEAGIKLSKQKPLFGYGSGNNGWAMNKLADKGLTYKAFKTDPKKNNTLHNSFINTLVNKGIVGLLILTAILFYLLYYFLSQIKNHYFLASLGLLHTIGFMVISLTSDPFNNTPANLFLPLVFIYIANIQYLNNFNKTKSHN